MYRLCIRMPLYGNVHGRLLVQDLCELGKGLLPTLIDLGTAGAEEEFVGESNINLPVFLADRQLVAAESKQGIADAGEDGLDLFTLFVDHVL